MEDIKQILKNKKGFIAALDQSGGSSSKTLDLYGVSKNSYDSDDEMFSLIHDMRSRIIKSSAFNSDKILGVILFLDTLNRKIDDKYTSLYLLDKGILSFLKIDKGLLDEEDGSCLMKEIRDLDKVLKSAKEKFIVGTKMRSLINEYNEEKIKEVVNQQFEYARKISSYGLIPIIEPEVNILSTTKLECEKLLKDEIIKHLNKIKYNVIFKLSLPEIDNFYNELENYDNVIRVVALSGGYTKEEACKKLRKNKNMIASFSRALLEGLNINDSENEFDYKLNNSIREIYSASVGGNYE